MFTNNSLCNANLKYMNRLILISLISTVSATSIASEQSVGQCIQQMTEASEDSVTVGEIKQLCQKKSTQYTATQKETKSTTAPTLVEQRLNSEKIARGNKFLLSTHKPNYILLYAHNDRTNEAPFALQFPNEDTSLDDIEVKFQISAKYPLADNVFGDSTLYFAYTNRSFWQLYNGNSAPFRETNHEPELFLLMPTDWDLFGFKNSFINFGFVHQSNGRSGTLSRSWNRIYASFLFEKGDLLLIFKPWYRIEEDEVDDDNPDIEDYMGNFELSGVYKLGNHTLSAMLRNTLDSNSNGAVQFDWVFPFTKTLSGYIQYFNGYGESLVDYNYDQESIGIGITLSGWL